MKDLLFQRAFGKNRSDGERLLNDDEWSLASFAYDAAFDEISIDLEKRDNEFNDFASDTASVISFDDKVEAVMNKFDSIISIFKRSFESKENFQKNYNKWAKNCKDSIKSLGTFADEMQTDKFNSDIARVVGGVVGTIGSVLVGLSFLTPLAVVTVPLAIGGGVASAVGGSVVVGTTGTEMVLVKKRLEKVSEILKEEQERFSTMSQWFHQPEELENAINSLVDFDILKEVSPEVQKFFDHSDRKNMTDEEFKNDFKQTLKNCSRKMNKDNKLTNEYGKELAPLVITFIFVVCLMKDHNKIVLNCVVVTQRLALGLISVLDFGVMAGALIGKLAARGLASAVAKIAIAEVFTCLGIVFDVLNVVVSSIDLHKKPETIHTKKIKEAAEKLEKIFFFIEGVYNETKKFRSPSDKIPWITLVVSNAPDDAGYEEIKIAFKRLLPGENWRRIKLRRLETKGNNWLVKMPESLAPSVLRQSHIEIEGKYCLITE